jgi:AcrR family transcriptional regulator
LNKTITPTVQPSLVDYGEHNTGRGRPTGRVSKRDWLDKALELLASGGIDAVRIVDLARQLNVSKSGFYWHFKDRAELLEAMKQYWVDEFSGELIKDTLADEGPLRKRLVSLIGAIRKKQSGRLDLVFMSWAQTDPRVQDIVDHVRDTRIAFIKDLLSKCGVRDEELELRARLFVIYFSWSDVMFESECGKLAGEDLNVVFNIIVGEDPV